MQEKLAGYRYSTDRPSFIQTHLQTPLPLVGIFFFFFCYVIMYNMLALIIGCSVELT